jgi:hypothetical protein
MARLEMVGETSEENIGGDQCDGGEFLWSGHQELRRRTPRGGEVLGECRGVLQELR